MSTYAEPPAGPLARRERMQTNNSRSPWRPGSTARAARKRGKDPCDPDRYWEIFSGTD